MGLVLDLYLLEGLVIFNTKGVYVICKWVIPGRDFWAMGWILT